MKYCIYVIPATNDSKLVERSVVKRRVKVNGFYFSLIHLRCIYFGMGSTFIFSKLKNVQLVEYLKQMWGKHTQKTIRK